MDASWWIRVRIKVRVQLGSERVSVRVRGAKVRVPSCQRRGVD